MNKLFTLITAASILSLGIFGFMLLVATKPQAKPLDVEEPSWIVKTKQVQLESLSPALTLYGHVESPYTTTLRVPNLSIAATQVSRLAVLEGDKLTQKQLLIQLDDRDSKLILKQRQADIEDIQAQITSEKQIHANNLKLIKNEEALLSLIQKSVERARKLQKQNLASRSNLDEAQQSLERQKIAVNNRRYSVKNHKTRLAQLNAKLKRAIAVRDLAKLEVKRLQIIAPYDAIVAKLYVAEGDLVRSNDPLLKVYDVNKLEVRAQIPSRYQTDILLSIEQTLQAKAYYSGFEFQFELARVSGEINPNNGGIDGLFKVTQGVEHLRLGEFLTLYLQLPARKDVIALPFESVYGNNRIYKFNDGRMHSLTIERVGEQIAFDGQSSILVRSPELASGDKVIVTQLPNAVEGLKVTEAP
ncbi:HlyD family efflux transporter periplasmic adaptor subunit [Candidatus Albibeggiatoa sp. nov. NOAA]|uniref:efflux RND transporter periplasmic adaptor subunit n=1 Tax=Candidatus Albibeggiatoa sp. nov. NOAA TaxID=3162724 RepID=UPI0032F2680D|nr:HlyD family efflux transporter periplasmic adaptor subunit [Thiotrichaceae bacterium]